MIEMNLIERILLCMSVGMECLRVWVRRGIIVEGMEWGRFLGMGFLLGVFEGVMGLLGWLGGRGLEDVIEG